MRKSLVGAKESVPLLTKTKTGTRVRVAIAIAAFAIGIFAAAVSPIGLRITQINPLSTIRVNPLNPGTVACGPTNPNCIRVTPPPGTQPSVVTGICGDGIVNQSTEQCDGSARSPSIPAGVSLVCDLGCQAHYCGNSKIDGTEQCDGSMRASGIPASATCSSTCTASWCDDSDGDNKIVRGTTTGRQTDGTDYSSTDSCNGTCSVNEYLCPGGTSSVRSCDAGTHCQDGACVAGGSGCGSGSSSPSCTDSDGGDNPSVVGTVSGVNADGSTYSSGDSCDIGDCSVIEGYCRGTDRNGTSHPCGSGHHCVSGACVTGSTTDCSATPSCTDSDGGDNPLVFGSVSGINADGSRFYQSDGCLGGGCSVFEWHCAGTDRTERYDACGPGHHCVEGACVRGATTDCPTVTPSCTDSDGGNNPSVYGTLSGVHMDGSTYSESDRCGGECSVVEGRCEGTSDRFYSYACGPGRHCMRGACIAGAATDCGGSACDPNCQTAYCNGVPSCSITR